MLMRGVIPGPRSGAENKPLCQEGADWWDNAREQEESPEGSGAESPVRGVVQGGEEMKGRGERCHDTDFLGP